MDEPPAARESLNGIINTLNDSGDLSDESDELAVTDLATVNDNIEGQQPLP